MYEKEKKIDWTVLNCGFFASPDRNTKMANNTWCENSFTKFIFYLHLDDAEMTMKRRQQHSSGGDGVATVTTTATATKTNGDGFGGYGLRLRTISNVYVTWADAKNGNQALNSRDLSVWEKDDIAWWWQNKKKT